LGNVPNSADLVVGVQKCLHFSEVPLGIESMAESGEKCERVQIAKYSAACRSTQVLGSECNTFLPQLALWELSFISSSLPLLLPFCSSTFSQVSHSC
jgi:hypothetical protein